MNIKATEVCKLANSISEKYIYSNGALVNGKGIRI
jgi:hypothetical protein